MLVMLIQNDQDNAAYFCDSKGEGIAFSLPRGAESLLLLVELSIAANCQFNPPWCHAVFAKPKVKASAE